MLTVSLEIFSKHQGSIQQRMKNFLALSIKIEEKEEEASPLVWFSWTITSFHQDLLNKVDFFVRVLPLHPKRFN
jgi:hypothetical protein